MNNTVLSQMRQRLEILYQMVEELEVNPGPGPTPTSDYNDLQNKPQIGGVELKGNKTAAQLGLATSSALNTVISNFEDLITPDNITIEDNEELPSSVDSRLTLHQPIMLNHAIYYCYDESGVDYTYVALDTSGAYPKLSYAQIFKDTKKVHFYDYATDTVPTSDSGNFITSGGVYTALASKQDSLSTAQLNAVNSGITSAKVTQYDKDSAAMPELVNNGAKNLVVPFTPSAIEGVTITRNADGSLTFVCENVTSNKIIKIGDIDAPSGSHTYVLSGCTGGTMQTYQIGIYDGSTNKVYQYDDAAEYTGDISSYIIRVRIVASEQSPFSGTFTVKPLLCTKAQWNVSQTYVPYCPDLHAINTWAEYECFYPAGAGNYFDGTTSSVKVKVNRALKRCVADISITTIASIDTSTNAFNFGTLSGIPNNTEIRPGASTRTLAVSKADNYTAVISKAPSNSTLSFFVSAGTIASGTSFSCQLSWDFA